MDILFQLRDWMPAVLAVRLVFNHQRGLAHQLVFHDDELRQTDTRVEVQVMKRQRVPEDVPDGLLAIKQVQIGVEREHTLGETLLETDLELHVAVVGVGCAAQHGAAYKVGVLVETEVRTAVQFGTDTVGNLFVGLFEINDLASGGESSQPVK